MDVGLFKVPPFGRLWPNTNMQRLDTSLVCPIISQEKEFFKSMGPAC
jgi:hypothetical protein